MSEAVVTTLDVLGASTELIRTIDSALETSPPGAVAGRVSRIDRGRFSLLTAQGPLAVATTGISKVCVGDWVIVGAAKVAPAPGDTYELLEVLPRTTALIRQASGSRTEPQALAANIDVVLVLVPLDREISPRQIERFLALALNSGALAVLVLTNATWFSPPWPTKPGPSSRR